jgi:hypothetical protein
MKKTMEIAVYVTKETVLKEMAAKLSKLSHHLFFDLFQELHNSTLYPESTEV